MNSSGPTAEGQTKQPRNNVVTIDNSTFLKDIKAEDTTASTNGFCHSFYDNVKHKANTNGFCKSKIAHIESSTSDVCHNNVKHKGNTNGVCKSKIVYIEPSTSDVCHTMSNEDVAHSSANLKSLRLNDKKERILLFWKYLVENIDPIPLLEELDETGLLAKKNFDKHKRKQRSHQVSLVLIEAYQNIRSEEDFAKFRQSVEQISVPCAEKLDEHHSPSLVEVDDIVEDQYKDIITRHRLELETKLHSSDFLEIVNDFVEASIFNIDELEKLVYAYPNREASSYFLDMVLSNLKRNAFDCLIKSISNKNRFRRFKPFLNEVNKSTKPENLERLVTAMATGEKELSPSDDNNFIKITHEDITDGLGNIRKNIDVTWVPAKIENIHEGSIIIDLSVLDCTDYLLNTKRITAHIKKMLERIYSDKAFQDRIKRDPFVEVTVNISGKDKGTSTAVQEMKEVDILAVNKSFLIEEIDTRTLTQAFIRKGIHCFDSIGLDTKTERRHKAEMFVAKLQSENLTNQLLQILEEEAMYPLLERLKTCQKAYSSYKPEMMNNIFRNMKEIVAKLECHTLRNTFVERNVFFEKFFDDLEKMFHDNEEQLKKEIVIEILGSGPFAMMTLLDVLYMNKLDKLAENIIQNEKRADTPKDLLSDRKQGIKLMLTFEMKLGDYNESSSIHASNSSKKSKHKDDTDNDPTLESTQTGSTRMSMEKTGDNKEEVLYSDPCDSYNQEKKTELIRLLTYTEVNPIEQPHHNAVKNTLMDLNEQQQQTAFTNIEMDPIEQPQNTAMTNIKMDLTTTTLEPVDRPQHKAVTTTQMNTQQIEMTKNDICMINKLKPAAVTPAEIDPLQQTQGTAATILLKCKEGTEVIYTRTDSENQCQQFQNRNGDPHLRQIGNTNDTGDVLGSDDNNGVATVCTEQLETSQESDIVRLPISLTKLESNVLPVSHLVLTLTEEAVRCLFDRVYPPDELRNIIKRNRTLLNELRHQRVFTSLQWNQILSHVSGSTATSYNFDLSLMIILFRNLSPVAPESFDYDKLPETDDRRSGADLACIKYYNNYIARCTANDRKLDYTTFCELWERVSKAVSGEIFKQKCSHVLSSYLDASCMPANVRENIAHMLNNWRLKDRCFVETAASKAISKIIETESVAIVTGSPGSGKSFTVQHILISMIDQGYDVIPVTTSSDIARLLSRNNTQVFFIDNFCGKYNISHNDIENWKRNETIIKEFIMKPNILYNENQNCKQNENSQMQTDMKSSPKIILACRLQIFNDPLFKSLHLDKYKVCNLSSDHKISSSEKVLMCKHYLSGDVINGLSNDIINARECFPLLCSLFESRKPEGTLFFQYPKTYFKNELDELRIKQDKIKYACIVLCVMYNDIVPFEIFTPRSNDRAEQIFDMVFNECEVHLSNPRKEIKTQFEVMVGSFFSKTETGYTSIHDYMFEIYCDHVCSTMLQCIVEYADSGLLHDRALLQSIGHDGTYSIIVIPENLELIFFHRIKQDINDCKIEHVFAASQMKHKEYRFKLIKVLENMELDINRHDIYGCTPLFVASRYGYSDVLDVLINKGGKVNMCSSDGTSPLQIASFQGDTCCVSSLLNNGAEVNQCDNNGQSPLFDASLYGKADVVEMLCNREADVNLCNTYGESPIYAASWQGHKDCVIILLNKGAKLNICDAKGKSPILIASFHGYADIVEMLCNRGADVNLCTRNRTSPIFAASWQGNKDCVNVLLDNGAEVNLCEVNRVSPIWIASFKGKTDIVEMLCNRGADVDLCNTYGESPIYAASKQGHKGCVNVLLNKGAKVNICDVNGKSPIWAASFDGKTDIVEMLCKRGADVNLCTTNGTSPLFAASWQGNKDCVNMLLDNGAKVNLCEVNRVSPIWIASFKNKTDIVEVLCNRGADVNLSRKDGTSPILAASWKGSKDCVNVLLDNGAEVNLCEVNGGSPIWIASFEGKSNIVEMLCNRGADINLSRKDGTTPIFAASWKGNIDCVKILLDNGAEVNLCEGNGESPIWVASSEGRTDIVEMLCNRGADVNLSRKDGTSPIFASSWKGKKDCVKVLLDNGAEINLCKVNGESPVWRASFEGHTDIVEMLCNRGADVNLSRKDGSSPIYAASMQGHKTCVNVLLDKGAEVNQCDSKGKSPLYVASFGGNTDIVEILCNRGADVNLCDMDGQSPLHVSSGQGHTDCVKLLMYKRAAVNLCDNNGESPLFSASHRGNTGILETLYNSGGDINLGRTDGDTLLHTASINNHKECVMFLLQKEVEVNKCNNMGESPLYLASREGHSQILQILCKGGGNVNLCDIHGLSPLSKAKSMGHKVCVDILVKNGANIYHL